jgi:L-fuculose-phosphate aldolase
MKMNYYKSNGEFELKKMIIDIGKRLWQRIYIASNDGNISVKINDNEILTTPTGVSKGFMTPDMIIKMSMDGKVLTKSSKYRPSSEVKMHFEVYREREDIKSVIHAHPPYCTSFAVAGVPLDKCVLPEAIIVIGAVPIAEYGTPSTMEIPDAIKPYVKNSDAILLANHGALTFGTDLISAYHKMETLEHTAQIVTLAHHLGNVNVLRQDQVDTLMQLRDTKFKVPGKITACAASPATAPTPSTANDETIQYITKQVIERLKNIKK